LEKWRWNKMKRLYPWIPFLGFFLTIISDPQETGLLNNFTLFCSAVYQAMLFATLITNVKT